MYKRTKAVKPARLADVEDGVDAAGCPGKLVLQHGVGAGAALGQAERF